MERLGTASDYETMPTASQVQFVPEHSLVQPTQKLRLPEQGPYIRQEGEYYIYRGMHGIPFRSKSQTPPDIKSSDPIQPILTVSVCVKVFDLSKTSDLQEYERVWDMISRGFYVLSVEDRHWVDSTQNWKIFLRWGIKYWELPEV